MNVQQSQVEKHELATRIPDRLLTFLIRLASQRRIRTEITHLCHPQPAVRSLARATLMAAPDVCRPPLLHLAFRTRSKLAYAAAELLYDMGDAQGLYALLSQYSDRYMCADFGGELRAKLQRIGQVRIQESLEDCLDELETDLLPHDDWPLAFAVYALNALSATNGDLPTSLWRRSLSVSCGGFEELQVCRGVEPLQVCRPAAPLASDDAQVGTTFAAIRRAAGDALVILNPQGAFALLAEAFQHPNVHIRLTAIYGLRQLRDPRSYLLLQPIAVNRRDPLSRDARRAIEAMGSSQPDALTLVRACTDAGSIPQSLLRPASTAASSEPDRLLRPTSSGRISVRGSRSANTDSSPR